MKISTFSVVVGTRSCNAGCKFCISHITGFEALSTEDIKWDRFVQAVALAKQSGCTTLLFTGKGEPTLYPHELTLYLKMLDNVSKTVDGTLFNRVEQDKSDEIADLKVPVFPFLELQTNALQLGEALENSDKERNANHIKYYKYWRELGLGTIAISTVGHKKEWNQEIYLNHRKNVIYPDLEKTINFLHETGYNVRICVMMQKGMVDSIEKIEEVVDWAKKNHVEQLTFRPIRRPNKKIQILNNPEDRYVMEYGLDENEEQAIVDAVNMKGDKIYSFTAGDSIANVYDFDGQNVCLSDCLTVSKEPNTIRTLIFYPQTGIIAYHWQYDSAKL